MVDSAKLSDKITKAAQDNPDMTYAMIKQILVAQEEVAQGLVEEYVFDKE